MSVCCFRGFEFKRKIYGGTNFAICWSMSIWRTRANWKKQIALVHFRTGKQINRSTATNNKLQTAKTTNKYETQKSKCIFLRIWIESESVNICVKVKGDITHLVVTGTVLRYKLSRIVFWRSWSTPPLGNRVFRYWRRSDVIEPERVNGQSVKVQLSFSNVFLSF